MPLFALCRGWNVDCSAGLVHIEETHPVTRLEKRAGLTVDVPHLHRRGADDLPAAGAVLRVDAAESTGQCYGAGRNTGARALPAGDMQRGITSDQITKTGSEAAEGNGEFAFGVPADNLLDAQAG